MQQEEVEVSPDGTGVSINCVVAGAIVIALYFSSISVTLKNCEIVKLSLIPSIYQPYLTGYVMAPLFLAAFSIWRKSFIKPEIKSHNCHWCGAAMTTSELTRQNCAATSARVQEKNEPNEINANIFTLLKFRLLYARK